MASFAKTSYNAKTDKIWFLVRGIEQEKLPDVFDYYREFEKPPVENSFLYISSDPYIKETKNTIRSPDRSEFCDNCHTAETATRYKTFAIEFSQTKSFVNMASTLVGGGIIIALLVFVILINTNSRKKT
ncbi:MAG: hypothetical protein WA063_06655 [Minisyncoccia bacterium]